MKISKTALRALWKEKRKQIPQERREKASTEGKAKLLQILVKASFILSYASFGEEFDTTLLNKELALQGKLLLPKVHQNNLHFFHIENWPHDLIQHSYGMLEPLKTCQEATIPPEIVLVPALAFDQQGYRLGYGGGFYDRLLKIHPSALHLGVGYQEQLSQTSLAIDSWDLPVHQLYLF